MRHKLVYKSRAFCVYGFYVSAFCCYCQAICIISTFGTTVRLVLWANVGMAIIEHFHSLFYLLLVSCSKRIFHRIGYVSECVCVVLIKSSSSMSMPFRMHTSLLQNLRVVFTQNQHFRIHSPHTIFLCMERSTSALPVSNICTNTNTHTHMRWLIDYTVYTRPFMAAAAAITVRSIPFHHI